MTESDPPEQLTPVTTVTHPQDPALLLEPLTWLLELLDPLDPLDALLVELLDEKQIVAGART